MTVFPFELDGISFERCHSLDRDDFLLPKLSDTFELDFNQLYFLALSFPLLRQPSDLVDKLIDPLIELRFLSGAGVSAKFEQRSFSRYTAGNYWIRDSLIPARQER